jgi:hypothetical protein
MSVVSSFTLHPAIMGDVRDKSNHTSMSFSSSSDTSAFNPIDASRQFIPIQNSVLVPGTMLQDRLKRSPSHRVELGDGTTCRPAMPNPFQCMNLSMISNHPSPQVSPCVKQHSVDGMSRYWRNELLHHDYQKKIFRLEEEKRKLRIQVIELQAKLLEKEEVTNANFVEQKSCQPLLEAETLAQDNDQNDLNSDMQLLDRKERIPSPESCISKHNHTILDHDSDDDSTMILEKNPTSFCPIASPKAPEVEISSEINLLDIQSTSSFHANDDFSIGESKATAFRCIQSSTTKDILHISEENQTESPSKNDYVFSPSTQAYVSKEENLEQLPSTSRTTAIHHQDMTSDRRTTLRQARIREGDVVSSDTMQSAPNEELTANSVLTVRQPHNRQSIDPSSSTIRSPQPLGDSNYVTTLHQLELDKSYEGISPISTMPLDGNSTSSDNVKETGLGFRNKTDFVASSTEESRPKRRRGDMLMPTFQVPALKKNIKRKIRKTLSKGKRTT